MSQPDPTTADAMAAGMTERGTKLADDAAERELRSLTYASVRSAASQRSPAVEALLAELDRLNLGAAARSGADDDGDAGIDPAALDEIDAMSNELMMRQTCYRAAIVAIAEPVTPSLAAFLA